MWSQKQNDAGRSIFMSSIQGLANTGAVAATFFLTPLIHSESVGWIKTFAIRHYGAGWDDLVSFAWFALIALLTFFVARASLGTLLIAGGFALATRVL